MQENRALVIKTYGDVPMREAIRGAILDSATREVIPLNNEELEAVKAEYARLKADYDELEAREAVRQSADEARWLEIKAELDAKHAVKTHGKVYNTVLLTWTILWLLIETGFARLWAGIEGRSYTRQGRWS